MVSLVLVSLALAVLGGPSDASSSPSKEVPVPFGLWSGYGKLSDVTAQIGDVEVNITEGTYGIWLLSDPAKEYANLEGQLTLDLTGTGQFDKNGVRAVANLHFFGVFDLGSLPYTIWADGSYRMTGFYVVNGLRVDVDQVIAVSQLIRVTEATCTKLKGVLPSGVGTYRWVAKLRNDLGTTCSSK
jgi:hypothetical protein